MNERTLLSFMCTGVKKSKGLKHALHHLFIEHFFNLSKLLELPLEGVNQVMDDYFASQYSKTASRKLLGNMNDLAHLYQATIAYNGGLDHCDLNQIIRLMNQTPQSNLHHKYSVDVAREILMLNKLN